MSLQGGRIAKTRAGTDSRLLLLAGWTDRAGHLQHLVALGKHRDPTALAPAVVESVASRYWPVQRNSHSAAVRLTPNLVRESLKITDFYTPCS